MICATLKEPNFLISLKDMHDEIYEWITYADKEESLRNRFKESTYTINWIKKYDYKEWQELSKEATLKAISDYNKEDFKFDSKIWQMLKLYLFDIFHGKCAYCESKLKHISPGDLEHYRPKQKVEEDPNHPGYYWLAYDVTNYLPSCELCNRFRGKRNFFPVENDKYAYNPGEEVNEKPLLINPCLKEEISAHLVFIPGEGKTCYGTVSPKSKRGEKTIDIFKLNRDDLVDERRKAQENIQLKILRHMGNSEIVDCKKIWGDLRSGESEYSAACLAHLENWWKQLDPSR